MRIQQLSLFLENKPAHLKMPCRILADAGINILTFSLADTQQYGILRLIVSNWEKARDALQAAGCVVKVTEIVALPVKDRPGGLADLLDTIDACGINIEYMYAFTSRRDGKPVMAFCFADLDAALEALQAKGVPVAAGLIDEFSDRETS